MLGGGAAKMQKSVPILGLRSSGAVTLTKSARFHGTSPARFLRDWIKLQVEYGGALCPSRGPARCEMMEMQRFAAAQSQVNER